jgi:putative transposase
VSSARRPEGQEDVFATRRDDEAVRRPDLEDRNSIAPQPNALWLADITRVRIWAGFCYVAFVQDAIFADDR